MRFLNYDIEHRAHFPWQFVQGKACYLRLRCNEPVLQIKILYGDPFWFAEGKKKEPVLEETDVSSQQLLLDDTYYSVEIHMKTRKLRYHFVIILTNGTKVILSEAGITENMAENQLRPFMVPYVFMREHYDAPDWANNYVWYQIFPDRFAGSGDPESFVPLRDNFFGGTLNGITEKIPYLKGIGVQGLYLNPIFQSPSNHRYDTLDYGHIDPRLGDREDFRVLVETLHHAGMKIMLDGVFNHCAWDHPFWQDVLHNGLTSPYFDWFCIDDIHALMGGVKEMFSPEIIKREHPFECFAFAANMPKWNTENEQVMDYLIGLAETWTRNFGIDAWRLDVPDEISMHFLQKFKRRVRAVSSKVYIIGEIWQDASFWIEKSVFDGVMDYTLYYAIRDFAMTGQDDLTAFAHRVYRWYVAMPEKTRPYQWGFCSNHDITRLLTECGGDIERAKLAAFLTTILSGNMSIYYGDEIGMTGGDDPDNRRAMRWTYTDDEWERFYLSIIRLKREIMAGCNIIRISLRDTLYITFKKPSGEKLLAVISSFGSSTIIQEASNWKPVFGNLTATDAGLEVCGFTLLESAEG